MRRKILVSMLLCLLAPVMLQADVADSAANGFTVKITTVIRAAPADVYKRLVSVGDWWSPDHTFSGDAHNLTIEDKPMGCFCEKLPNGGGVRHAEVIVVMPNQRLVMSGMLGPLQKFGGAGTMSFVLTPTASDTRLEVTYAVGGYLPDGLNTWAGTVDKVLTMQLTRLKNYVESGNANAAAGATNRPQ
jgi:uncharacterized protein YndB with AHSA1/START domain